MTRNYSAVRNILLVLVAGSAVLILGDIQLLWRYHASWQPAATQGDKASVHSTANKRTHPIGKLMSVAEVTFQEMISRQSLSVSAAAEDYRARRGRHPPPGFDAWYAYAEEHNAVIVEELFDQIYRDLTPFWGVAPKMMRDFARHFEHHIYVRNGTVDMTRNHGGGTPTDRMEAWLDLVRSVGPFLPDLDLAINLMDESRVIVPWESIDKYVGLEAQTRGLLPLNKVTSQYQSYFAFDNSTEEPPRTTWIGPGEEAFWDTARVGCTPQAAARFKEAATNFAGPPPYPSGYPMHSLDGYVRNWTQARDPCQQPHLQEAHGTFIEPISVSTTHQLVPIFGESKLSMNNDILIPPAAYLSESFSGGLYSDANAQGANWDEKTSGVVWRGVASGGRNREETWTRFHRHRFVSMLNGSYMREIEMSPTAVGEGKAFIMQSYARYHIGALNLGAWLQDIADVGFTDLLCWPGTGQPTCNYTDPYFSIAKKIPMAEQYKYKILPDIDGNSYSGRYLAFLRSTSLPLKATIYSEWHDDRLIPWLHFVPMDNMFVDVYGILEYFLGTKKSKVNENEKTTMKSRDNAAEKIALRGKEWAEKVLRKEDMQIYMLRLLLEYARLCDDNRDSLGFVGDPE
ncbi:hypothetical protein IAQ61_006964 [Plenodomus lingam]|uniref:Similar to capsule-associated protein CAP1 n=1 Tax=Leptosphaeria maculans (strain JN3 / isolate v23.1.3 / race Av1-4-5-6-7-8) TaxID=985895 RepID=E5AD28_LEPMJ|nr:similar to capsule-associated protein CAP1 [Plenodomus lingam JN3]KAH9869751.1 hypothetical protein IAQ61_006964 [Plenodomus lingam]CBY02380.1 similar to capsule-associated protein CAP1 [Plenodomus lingam JN3]